MHSGRHHRSLALAGALVVSAHAAALAGESASFWVWHRDATLEAAEAETLRTAGVRTLYWHVGTMRVRGGSWESDGAVRALPREDGIEITPVFRLEAAPSSATGDPAALAEILARYARQFDVGEIQLDYDCPDRLLSDYAALLRACRGKVQPTRLSATALAGWIRLPKFQDVADSVDMLAPMFYDLEADSAGQVRQGTLRPLADDRMIGEWTACRVPWLAGLPAFARLSLFESDGRLSGHLRNWSWEELVFHPALRLHPSSTFDVTVLDVVDAGRIGSAGIEKGQRLALRMPVVETLAAHVETALSAGARGIVWFRLPDAGSQTPLDIATLAGLPRIADRSLTLRFDASGRAVLQNDGPAAIPPRVSGRHGEQDRGYQLEIDAGAAGVFRAASAGEFVRMAAHRDPDAAHPIPDTVESSRRLTFWFGELPAGEALRTGAIVLNNGAARSSNLRWRVDGGEWHPLR